MTAAVTQRARANLLKSYLNIWGVIQADNWAKALLTQKNRAAGEPTDRQAACQAVFDWQARAKSEPGSKKKKKSNRAEVWCAAFAKALSRDADRKWSPRVEKKSRRWEGG